MEIEPSSGTAAAQLAVVLAERGAVEEARRLLAPRLAAPRPAPVILWAAGRVRMAEGDTLEAEAAWREALRRAPRFLPAHTAAARLRAGRGQADEALTGLRRLLAAGAPVEELGPVIGELLLAAGRPEEARVACRAMLEDAPGDAGLTICLARAQAACGHPEEAASVLKSARRRHPDNARVTRALIGVLAQQDRWDEVARLWEPPAVPSAWPEKRRRELLESLRRSPAAWRTEPAAVRRIMEEIAGPGPAQP
ncbi:MAG: tetratricopeptide repeat protein [Candidatus Eisenbacteria bacterium]|nr:tetratricopeptide repeat protein [Candidatus Eisenbacteria bacterium]